MGTGKNEFVLEKLVETLTQACLDLNPLVYREIMPRFAENQEAIGEISTAVAESIYSLRASCKNLLKLSRFHRATKQKK